MEHNRPANSQTATRTPRMKANLKKGIESWFDVDDITIHIWGSAWTGREIISIQNGGQPQVVSDKRSFRFTTPHEFDYGGQRYRVELQVALGKANVRLYRNGELIDSDEWQDASLVVNPETGRLDWLATAKELGMFVLAGGAIGFVFGVVLAVVTK